MRHDLRDQEVTSAHESTTDRARGSGLVGLLLPCLAACGATVAPAPPPSPMVVAPRPAALPPATVSLGVSVESPEVQESAFEGRYYTVGGLRAEFTAAGVVFSTDRVVQRFARIQAVDGGWLFVDENGLVLASPQFTGTLRVLGMLRSPWVALQGIGRVPFRTADGYWVADANALTRVGEPPGDATSIVCGGAQMCAAVLAEGRLVVSHDVGHTWTPVDLGADIASSVHAQDHDLLADTSHGTFSIEPTGTLRPWVPPRGADYERHDEAVRRAYDEHVAAHRLRPRQFVRLSDGTTVARQDSALVRFGADGRVDGRVPLTDADAGSPSWDEAEVRPWGSAIAVVGQSFLRTSDGRTLETIEAPPGVAARMRGLRLSDDGVHAAVDNACNGEQGSVACVRDDHGAWHSIPIIVPGDPNPSFALLDMRGASLLLSIGSRGTPPRDLLFVLDTTTREVREVRPAIAGDAWQWSGPPRWTRDGLIAGLVEAPVGAASVRSLALGPPDAPIPLQAVPAGTRAVAFADAQHGLALGESTDAIWRSVDGGHNWARVDLPIVGPAIGLERDHPADCDDSGCDVWADNIDMRIQGWGGLGESHERLFTSEQVQGTGAPVADTTVSEPPRLGRITCEATSRPTRSPWRGRGLSTALQGLGLAVPDTLRRVTSEGIYARYPAWNGPFGDSRPWRFVRSARDGSSLLWELRFLSETIRYDGMFELDGRGTIRTSRLFSARQYHAEGVAQIGGRWGRVTFPDAEPARFEPIAGALGTHEPLPAWHGVAAPCATPAALDVTTVIVPLDFWEPPSLSLRDTPPPAASARRETDEWRLAATGTATVELSAGGTCLRELTGFWNWNAGRDARLAGASIHAAGNALEGYYDDLVERRNVRCESR